MGRGRGKGKKVATSHEDTGSGDEVLHSYKRRGRPQKLLKEDVENYVKNIVEVGEGEHSGAAILEEEVKVPITVDNIKKRKGSFQMKEKSKSMLDENDVTMGSNTDDSTSTRANGLRQNGSRRKSTPRRAAEAGVLCK